jgi:von Willebrand factor type A domain
VPQDRELLPFYLLIDVSWSMYGEKIKAANQILPELVDALVQNPIVSDKVRFGLLDFAGTSRVVVPLSDLLDVDTIPVLECRTDGTNYSAALDQLHATITEDVEQLKADGFRVHRPAVFFVSDGEPQDDPQEWEAAFGRLTAYDHSTHEGFAYYPNLIPFAIDQANPETLIKLVHPPDTMRMFVQKEDANPGQAIAGIAQVLVRSVLKSSKQGEIMIEATGVRGVTEVLPAAGSDAWI